MSQYTHIFVRHNDEFIELGCYSRSNKIAEIFNRTAPYEKIASYTSADILDCVNEVREEIERYEVLKKSYQERLAQIPSFNNSIEDKMDAMTELQNGIVEIEDELTEYKYAKSVLLFLSHIADEYEMNVKYEGAKDQPRVYVGIECGSNPTLEDVAR